MSRRARIAIKEENGGKSIYLHNSEEPSKMLEFLKKYYYQKDKVKKIIELGDCSILAEKLEPTKKGHSFNNPEENVSIFYGRDRNETNVKAIDFKNRDELIKQAKDSWADDCYIYNKEQGRWDIL